MRYPYRIKLSSILILLLLYPLPVFAGGGHDHGDHDDHGHGHEEEEEGVVSLTPEAFQNAKISISEAGPGTISSRLKVSGRITPVSSKVAHISPRFSGIIKDVRVDIGDFAKVGDVLAIIESNQTLQPFEVRTLKSGLIVARHATVGESVQEDEALFIVIDLSELWADFTIFQRDVPKIKTGQAVDIYLAGQTAPYKSTIHFISPVVDESTQSRIVRTVVSNPDGALAPGAFVTGEISIGDFQVPLAITSDAIQTIGGKTVTFVQEGEKLEMREIKTGRTDGHLIEVLAGLKGGERYAATNTFILKADLGKGEAEHEH